MTPEIRNLLKEARTIIRAHARWAAKDWDERATKAFANLPQRTEQEPCAKHCEATAFEIVIKNLQGEIERMKTAQRTWVDLTDTQIEQVYFDVVQEHRGAPMPWGQVQFGRALLDKFKEKNT